MKIFITSIKQSLVYSREKDNAYKAYNQVVNIWSERSDFFSFIAYRNEIDQ